MQQPARVGVGAGPRQPHRNVERSRLHRVDQDGLHQVRDALGGLALNDGVEPRAEVGRRRVRHRAGSA